MSTKEFPVKSLWLPLKWLPLLSLLAVAGLGPATSAGADDEKPLPYKIEVVEGVDVKTDLFAVRSMNPTSGTNKSCLAVGAGGVMLRSDDGGKKWKVLKTNTTADLHDVRFANINLGVAVGEGGKYPIPGDQIPGVLSVLDPEKGTHILVGEYPWSTILRTVDGGKTWTRIQAPTNFSITGVMWMDGGKRALAITGDFQRDPPGNGSIMCSEDTGLTWRVLYNVGCPLRGITIMPDNTGLVVGWAARKPEAVNTRTGIKKLADLTKKDKDDMPVDFRRRVTIPDGWNVSAMALGPPQLHLKTDSVAADAITVKEGAPIFGVQITPDRAWVVGELGMLSTANKKNRKWGDWTDYAVDEKSKVNFRAIAFKEREMINGLVVGEGGVVLGTVDSGKTWKRIESGTDKALHGLMWHAEGAVIIGAEGTILRVSIEKPSK